MSDAPPRPQRDRSGRAPLPILRHEEWETQTVRFRLLGAQY
jgi:hypothetical protein